MLRTDILCRSKKLSCVIYVETLPDMVFVSSLWKHQCGNSIVNVETTFNIACGNKSENYTNLVPHRPNPCLLDVLASKKHLKIQYIIRSLCVR